MSATPGNRETDQEALLAWACQFIEDLAQGRDRQRYSLEDLSVEQHAALALVAEDWLTHRRSTIRRAAAWVVGAADVHAEDAPVLLCRLLHDRVVRVRMAAAWACAEFGAAVETILPGLVEALGDPNDGVRFAAVSSLGELGERASPAVEVLIAIAASSDQERIRAMALKSLADIAPNHPGVQTLLARSLEHAGTDGRFFAAYGIGQAASCPEVGVRGLTANIESVDPYLVQISAWAIGKLGNLSARATPAILTAMKRLHWLQIEHSELQGQESVSIRPDFTDALERILPTTDDTDYQDFRLRFFSLVFHPTPLEQTEWIDEIVNHPWYLKLQRRRFGHPTNASERQAIREMVRDAQEKFANRLRKNPTLGLSPEEYKLLPGFIKNHCRNIAWRLLKQKAGPQKKGTPRSASTFASSTDTDGSADAGGSTEEVHRRLREFIDAHLPEDEREVARCRWTLHYTIAETASFLNLTPSQVKTREGKARATAARLYERGGL